MPERPAAVDIVRKTERVKQNVYIRFWMHTFFMFLIDAFGKQLVGNLVGGKEGF